MGTVTYFLALVIAGLVLLAGQTRSFAQDVNDKGCYGSSIEVLLSGGVGDRKVALQVPTDSRPVIYAVGPDGKDVDPSKICLREPITAHSVYFWLDHKPAAPLGIQSPTLRRMKITYGEGWSTSYYQQRSKRLMESVRSGTAKSNSAGFLKLYPTENSSAGEYISENIFDPSGHRLEVICAPMTRNTECSVHYGLQGGVAITYWFLAEAVSPEHWVELDKEVRTAVETIRTQH